MQYKNTQYNQNVLYISDLDGTLMNDNEEISSYSAHAINDLVKEGTHFAYATVRSYVTISFGDGKNDIPMFEISDELKSICTEVTASNNDDGVAKWLEEHAK